MSAWKTNIEGSAINLLEGKDVRDADVIFAIRLALIGARDDKAAVSVIRAILRRHTVGDGKREEPVKILLRAIKDTRAGIRVAA